ncbi:DUF4252 domain-containing protein [Kaistella palustris]|uniref:DUF4252 domain-containing protein n=1 Tax=Kaistella palustris TaxID=493376 RepID=UPI00048735F8|nr:DUF4252 domain-containing protein [Kaistella palustris]
MKSLYAVLALSLLGFTLNSCMVSTKPKMEFFNKAAHDYREAKFTSINVPMFLAKPIVKKALREDGESEELINLIRKISDIKVMTIENGNKSMLADYANYLANNNFEEWMTVRKENETVNFQAKQTGDVIKKLLISIQSGSESVFVDVSGKFTADDISRIINYSEKNDVKKIVSK